MENSNDSMNMNQTPGAPGVHESHTRRNLMAVLLLVVIAVAGYFILMSTQKMDYEDDTYELNTMNAEEDGFTEVTSTNDDLSSIEADFNAIDFDSLDAGLE